MIGLIASFMTSDHADSFKIMVHMEVDTAQKMMFSIKDSSVNVNKSEGNCGFGHIY